MTRDEILSEITDCEETIIRRKVFQKAYSNHELPGYVKLSKDIFDYELKISELTDLMNEVADETDC